MNTCKREEWLQWVIVNHTAEQQCITDSGPVTEQQTDMYAVVVYPTWRIIGHFGDYLSSKSIESCKTDANVRASDSCLMLDYVRITNFRITKIIIIIKTNLVYNKPNGNQVTRQKSRQQLYKNPYTSKSSETEPALAPNWPGNTRDYTTSAWDNTGWFWIWLSSGGC